jgi:hypothetical protein
MLATQWSGAPRSTALGHRKVATVHVSHNNPPSPPKQGKIKPLSVPAVHREWSWRPRELGLHVGRVAAGRKLVGPEPSLRNTARESMTRTADYDRRNIRRDGYIYTPNQQIHTHTHTHTHIYIYIYIYIYTHIISTHMYIYKHAYIYIHTYAYISICTHISIHTHTYTHIHTHTHVHT